MPLPLPAPLALGPSKGRRADLGDGRDHLQLVRRPVDGQVSDTELVVQARAGDEAARRALYLRHVDYVAGLAVRILRSRDEGADVVQETFEKAFRSLASLREPAAFHAWVGRIALTYVRRRRLKRRLFAVLGWDSTVEDAPLEALARPAGAEARVALAELDRALARLPEADRTAWMVRHVEGESLEDAAAATGCSLATMKRRLARADLALREALGEEFFQ